MPEKKIEPLVKLTPQQRKELEDKGGDLASIEKAIIAFKDLGMDTTEIEDKLAWAKKAREIILREFT